MSYQDKLKPINTPSGGSSSYQQKLKPINPVVKEQSYLDRAVAPYVQNQKESIARYKEGKQGIASTIFQTGGNLVGSALSPFTQVFKEKTPEVVKKSAGVLFTPVSYPMKKSSEAISNIPAVQRFAQTDLSRTLEKNIEAGNEYLNILPVPKGVGAIGKAGGAIEKQLTTSVDKIAQKTIKSPDVISKAVDDLEQTYTNIMSGTTPGAKKISKIEQKTEMLNKAGTVGKTPQRVLAENGVIPKLDGTKIKSFEQAEDFRKTIEPLRQANREALQEVERMIEPIDLNILEQEAIAYARTPKNINSGAFDKMQKEIQSEFALLRQNYPDGRIPLTVVDDIKAARWDNVFKNKGLVDADVLKKDSEYAIAKALQKKIEEVAELSGNKNVAQLNREIGDRLEASKFLEDLNGKIVKGGRLLKYMTTLMGSSLGQGFIGKVVGAIGGNVVGDIIISSQISNPLKRLILKNLQKQDPKTYTQTIQWLQRQNLDQETRLLLPPAPATRFPIINQGRPIPVLPEGRPIDVISPEITAGRITPAKTPQSKSPTK